jgi:hypothetical protein
MARVLCDVCAMALNPGHSKVSGLSHSECVILGLLNGGLISSCTCDSILKILSFITPSVEVAWAQIGLYRL